MLQKNRIVRLFDFLVPVLFIILFFISCSGNKPIAALKKQDLFNLQYGSFENELQLFAIEQSGEINTHIIMRDGFFYIANGEAEKIIQLTSYGDLVGILYNDTKNPVPSFVDLAGKTVRSALESPAETATQRAAIYPFNKLGLIAVDGNKKLYAADYLPQERYQKDENSGLMLRQVVLRFSPDGAFSDYLGQEGPGGTPFPFIKKLYTTKQNELVVVCLSGTGYIVFWLSQDGYLKYRIPLDQAFLPPSPLEQKTDSFMSLEQVIPDYEEQRLYLKIDYYATEIDESTKVHSGVVFEQSLVYPLDISAGKYGMPLSIPAYEQSVSYGYSKEVYLQSYDFLGVTESRWFFFMTRDDSGFSILMTRDDGQRLVRRHLELPLADIIYHDFSLSKTGIISAMLAEEAHASVVWWRTDTLIDTIIQ